MRSACKAVVIAATILSLQGCTTFDPLDQRGETINRNATDYTNNAELMNVVRASLSEPLTFLTITSVSGTASAQFGLGLPSMALGPHGTSPRDYVFGPNSATRNNSNTFNASIVDDPASYTALLAPINPALIAFFEHQGYTREELFFLFVDEIRQVTLENGSVTSVVSDFKAYDPLTDAGKNFRDQLSILLVAGLTSEIDISTTPTGRSLPPSKLCLNPELGPSTFGKDPAGGPIRIDVQKVGKWSAITPIDSATLETGACDKDPWLSSKASDAASNSADSKAGATASKDPSVLASSDNTLWLRSDDGKIIPFDRVKNGWVKRQALDTGAKQPNTDSSPSPNPTSQPMVGYPLEVTFKGQGTSTLHYQILLRSTYGAYAYLGGLLHDRVPDLDKDEMQGNAAKDLHVFAKDEMDYTGLLNIEAHTASMLGRSGDCFAEAEYRGIKYCVPQLATRTKRLFTLLHQLQELNTAPSNTPATLTLTAVH